MFLTITSLLSSCGDAIGSGREQVPEEIISFSVSGGSTKAVPVTELSSFHVRAAAGEPGMEEDYWGEDATVTKSGSIYYTGKYWAASDPELSAFYASNASLSFDAEGCTVTVDGSTDVVCAYLPSPAYKTRNALTFEHILARVGTLTLNTQTGYTLSAVSATLEDAVTGGTFNLRTGEWSALSSPSGVALSMSEGGSANDLWVVPGDYYLSVSYTLTKGTYSVSLTKHTVISLLAGGINNVTCSALGGNAPEEERTPSTFETEFGDSAASSVVLSNWDSNGDGVLSSEEIAAVTTIGGAFRNNTTVTEIDLSMFTNVDALSVAEFSGCTNLETVVLPEGLEIIYRNAFYNCTSLTSITLPSTLTTIYYRAFGYCSSLTSITIPASVTEIRNSVFYYCTSLMEINMLPTTPPDLNKINANDTAGSNGYWFTSMPSGWQIKVPSESVTAYKSATNWSNYATKIVAMD